MPRHNLFSNAEMRDMLCIYAQENFNGRSAGRRYQALFPNRRQPNRKLFQNIYGRLGETGSFRQKKDVSGRPKNITPEQEEEILVRVAENPEVSSRRLKAATGVSKSSIVRIFHDEGLYPYHFTPVQCLLPPDLPARLQFSHFFQNLQNTDPMFLNRVLFTDEATFTRRGVFNYRNRHAWENENPHLVVERHFQHEFKVNIWCGIIGDHLIGPFELPPTLNGDSYLNFLQNELGGLLEDVPLNVRQNMYFMQDGAPAHFSRQVRNYLTEQFPERWIGRGGPLIWPARSPDFNPMDFCIWGYLKTIVYNSSINHRNELNEKIINSVNLLRNDEDLLFKIRQSFVKRIAKCIEVNGGHFEQLLSRRYHFYF